jgi:hypothetical protein
MFAGRWSGNGGTPLTDHRPATQWAQHTTSRIAQSNAPEDGKIVARNTSS